MFIADERNLSRLFRSMLSSNMGNPAEEEGSKVIE
jgi:hypothetical protein